jgi:hypothetical protein
MSEVLGKQTGMTKKTERKRGGQNMTEIVPQKFNPKRLVNA